MKILLLAVVAAVALQAVIGTPVPQEVPDNSLLPVPRSKQTIIEDSNEFVDAILDQLKFLAIQFGLDPMQLPDELNGISVTILFIRYHGELWFTNGWLQNLSTIFRAGEAQVSQVDNILRIQTYVKFDRLFMTYGYRAQIMNIGPKGDVIGTVDNLIISIDLLVDMDTCDSSLKELKIADAGKLDIRFDGTFFFDEIFNVMSDTFVWFFKGTILNIVQSKFRTAVEEVLLTIDFGVVTGVPCGPQRAIPMENTFLH